MVNYNYDKLGNRDTVVDSATTSYTSNELNQYTDVDNGQGMPLSLQYDFNGNLLNDENNTYEYDYENRLTKAITADNIIEYAYDAFGRRTEKNIFDTNRYQLNAIRYVYDGDQVIGEYDASGSLLRKYVYGTGIDEPIQVTRHTTQDTFYYHFDGLGSVVALTDSSGATVESYEYDVYGNSLILDANRQTLTASQIGNSYMFTGRRFDQETGLYYYRARYYNSELGRFLQTDPIGYYDSMNLYQYCGNNGVNYVDPMGLCKDKPWWEKLEEGYYYGTEFGEYARDWYIQQWGETGNWLWGIPGGFAALWTQDTYQQTTWTLITAYELNKAFVRPHYSQVQYYPKNNPSYRSQFSTRGSTENLPHSLGEDARRALNLPNYNPADAARNIKVNPLEPLLGPGHVKGGTGIEYIRPWR